MGYELTSAQKAAVLDQDGNPIATDSIHGGGGTAPPFPQAMATMQDDGSGFLEIVATAPGTGTFAITSTATGSTSAHDVTVTAAPFDWTLGDPTAK